MARRRVGLATLAAVALVAVAVLMGLVAGERDVPASPEGSTPTGTAPHFSLIMEKPTQKPRF